MIPRLEPQWARRGGVAAAALALVSVAIAAVEAWQLEPLPVGVAHPDTLPPDADVAPTASSAQLLVLLESNPFHPERRRPDVRFGAEVAEPTLDQSTPQQSSATVQLLGTVVLPQQRSIAMCRIGNERARLLRVGDTLGSLKLAEIGQGRAVFVGSRGARLDLTVQKGGT